MENITLYYYLVIIALFSLGLYMTYAGFKRKAKSESGEKNSGMLVADVYGSPIDIITPAFSVTLRNFAPVALYHDYIMQGRIKIEVDDIKNVTFNNYAPAELPNEYQVIVSSKTDTQKIITIPVGDDLNYATELAERINEIYKL